jgi:hypothetical protein
MLTGTSAHAHTTGSIGRSVCVQDHISAPGGGTTQPPALTLGTATAAIPAGARVGRRLQLEPTETACFKHRGWATCPCSGIECAWLPGCSAILLPCMLTRRCPGLAIVVSLHAALILPLPSPTLHHRPHPSPSPRLRAPSRGHRRLHPGRGRRLPTPPGRCLRTPSQVRRHPHQCPGHHPHLNPGHHPPPSPGHHPPPSLAHHQVPASALSTSLSTCWAEPAAEITEVRPCSSG